MARSTMMLLLAFLLISVSWAKKPLTHLKVQVVAQSEGFQGKYQRSGIVGTVEGARTFATATLTTAIINGDHALLKCYENHHECNVLGAGEYDAEMQVRES